MNLVIVTGRLGADVEILKVSEKSSVARFSVAETKTWKKENGEQESRTVWHKLQAWNKMAEICNKNLKKGMKVMVTGELDYHEYNNKKDETVKETIIKIKSVEFDPKALRIQSDAFFTAEDIAF